VWEFSSGAALNLTFTSDHKLVGNFKWEEQGLYSVYISVSDGINKDTRFFMLNVTNSTEPYITTPDVTSCYEDLPYIVDYDNSSSSVSLSWTLDTNADFLTISSNTGILSGYPDNDDVGSYWVKVSLWGASLVDSHNFTLTVINQNDDPYITTNNVLQASMGDLYQVIYSAVDPDGDPLEWRKSSNATFLSIDRNTGTLSGTPSWNDVGTCWVNVSVRDGNGGLDFTNFTLTVNGSTPELEFEILVEDIQEMEGHDNRVKVTYDGDDKNVTVMWFIEGIGHMGNGSELILDLDPGTYNLTMRVIDSSNNTYETSTTIIIEGKSTSPDQNIEPIIYMLALAVIVILVLGILSIMIYRRQNRERKMSEAVPPKSRSRIPKDPKLGPRPIMKSKVNVVGGRIDDVDMDIEPSNMYEENTPLIEPDIEDIIAQAREMEKYTDFIVSKKELIGRARLSYRNEEIPKDVYMSIKEQLEE
jgi:hypothetical protein